MEPERSKEIGPSLEGMEGYRVVAVGAVKIEMKPSTCCNFLQIVLSYK